MPSLDGGHYFLTALLPIDDRGIIEHDGLKSSPVHMVREALETLPTALQSPASARIGLQSPFARSLRTHFARFVVIDAPFYNGRDPADSILSAIAGTNLLSPQPVDRLTCPYLFFAADFDPASDGEPRGYLEELWTLAETELKAVLEYCYGFEAVITAADFASYVARGQVETTMPFNDYWPGPPPLPTLSIPQILAAPATALVVSVVATVFGGLGFGLVATKEYSGWLGAAVGLVSALVVGVLAVALLVVPAVFFIYRLVMRRGARPFPTAPNSTLQDVLKALYLQQAFTRFAVAQQGSSPAELRAAFQDFVARTRPDDVAGPTQPPGVIRTADA
ncbi:MAG TPA: hypothetical protein VHW60_19265 [Caulobacteraceae bacterium]|jgi:hypothetical protein|nr:hypothetical protein [Caulobacteraceae bacterium]